MAQIFRDMTNHYHLAMRPVFCGFRFTHLGNMGVPSLRKGTNQVIPKNESLIQKPKKERIVHFLAPPPSAFLAPVLFSPELGSKPVLPALQP